MYFEKMPKFDYNFPFFPNAEMVDIFRRVKFTKDIESDSGNFETYRIEDGQKPEDVAVSFYGDPQWWWLVLLSNNIIDVENEWHKSSTELNSLFSNYLNGNSYFIFEQLDIQKEDILVKRDTSDDSGIDYDIYGVIDSYDNILHKINVKKSKGTINEGDEVHVFRNVGGAESPQYELISGFGATGCFPQFYGATSCVVFEGPDVNAAPFCATAGSTFARIQKTTTIKDSISRFEYQSDPISPYARFIEGVGQSGDYFSFQNMCGLTGTVLYQYMNSTEEIPSNVNAISVYADIVKSNDKKRNIRLISPTLISKISSELSALLKGDVPRGTTIVIE